jgi:hypothetical protein
MGTAHLLYLSLSLRSDEELEMGNDTGAWNGVRTHLRFCNVFKLPGLASLNALN